MKTHKRTPWQHTTQPCLKADGELRCTINEQAARWKRKNRVKRFKETIARLRAVNAQLTAELQNETTLRFSALKALLETKQELDKLRKEQSNG